jgi:ubiquinone/menaquinone biosynthesis C-methylase UbiE
MDENRFRQSFGSVAESYERGRPSYPDAAIELLARELGLNERSTVVDVAAGTGKLTRALVPRFGRVIAIEPLAEMRDVLAAEVPGAEVLDGRAEAIPLADDSADAVLVAQAFHWFDGPRALAEAGRVLRPAGGLGLVWNTTPWEERATPWFSAVNDVLEEGRVDLSVLHRHASGRWMEAFDGGHGFEDLASSVVDNPQLVAPADLTAGLASRSYMAVLPEEKRAELLGRVAALLERDDAPIEDGLVVVPMRTLVYWARLAD